MDQDTLTPSEQRLREQLIEGCRLARELDERVRSIPTGTLSVGSTDQSDAAASSSGTTQLRCSIAIATADVVAAFNKSIKLLLQSADCPWDHSSTVSAASSPLHTALHASPQQKAAKPCVPSVEAINRAAEQTTSPPHSTTGWHVKSPSAADQYKRQSNRASASATPSPARIFHSPSLLSDMSDGSPNPNQLDLPADDATTANTMKAIVSRKRKPQPKVSLKMPAGSERNTPPDDGHTWRKYGQKNILGAQYPRSYYRCTHKTDTGCPAIKQVQRCDEDDSFFDVVYKHYHTCRSAELDKECWPLAFPQGLSSMLRFPNRSAGPHHLNIPSAAASFMLANMSADNLQQSSPTARLDNLLCHVASSDAFPELSVTQQQQALTPRSAPPKLISERNTFNSVLNPYQFNSGQALLAMINGSPASACDHLHTLLTSNSAAAIHLQDESAMKDEVRGAAAATAIGRGQDEHVNSPYTEAQQGRAVNTNVEEWVGLEDNNGDQMYKRLATTADHLQHATTAALNDIRHRRLLLLNIPKHDDASTSSLASFDGMDNDADDLLDYLDP